MRLLFRSLFFLAIFIGLLVAIAYATGNDHLIRGVRSTYLIGHTSPQIDDRDLFPSVRIRPSDPVPWPVSSFAGILKLKPDQLKELNELASAGFLVIRNDSILFEQYWEGWARDRVLNAFSVSKSFVGALTGIALREGVLRDVHQKVSGFLPEFSDGCRSELTIWHLLTMSTGLDWSESSADPFSDNARAYYGRNVRSLSLDQPCRTAPGVEFDYISGNTQILAELLEAAYDRPLHLMVEEKLWTPLNAEYDAWWGMDRIDGDLKAFCCLYATNRDLARLGQLYLDSGMWRGRQIIDREFWLHSIKPAPLKDGTDENRRYGQHWWIAQIEGGQVHYARGIHGQYIIVIPHEQLVIVRTGRERGEVGEDGHPVDLYTWIDIALELSHRAGGPHIADRAT